MKNSAQLFLKETLSVWVVCLIIFSGTFSFGQTNFEAYSKFKDMAETYRSINLDSSLAYSDSAIHCAFGLSEKFYLGEAFQAKGQVLFLTWQLDSALYYQKKSCDVFQYYPDSVFHFTSQYNLGNIYLALEEDIQALLQFKKVLRTIDENFDSYMHIGQNEISLNKAYCYTSIGMVYDHQGDYWRCLSNMQKGLKIATNVPGRQSEILQAVTLGNMGQSYYELGNYDLAESYAIAGMEMKQKLGLESSSGYNYQVLAKAAYGRKKYPLSLKYLTMSDKYFGSIQNKAELDYNQLLRAMCFSRQKKNDLALEILHQSERNFDDPGAKKERIELYQVISEIYIEKGDFKNSTQYLKMLIQLKDEMAQKAKSDVTDEFIRFFDEEENRIDDKLTNFKNLKDKEKLELEVNTRKEKEVWIYSLFIVSTVCLILIIIVITRGNRRSKKINQELNYSMGEKEILFREVHHRVKNNFQIISSLLNLQQGIEEDTRSKKVLIDAQGRIQSMSLVHELLYRKNEVKRIDFKTYTQELVSSIIRSYTNDKLAISCEIECENESFDLELAVPLGLILNEAITNAVKYAFSGKNSGAITVRLKPIDTKNYSLQIKDDGVGIPEEFINGSKETLGVELINILSQQLGGSATFLNSNGTEVNVIFSVV